MNAKTWRRIAIAALVSLSCYSAITYWYNHSQSSLNTQTNMKPVAYVDRTVDEVSRRPVSRLLWQVINTGEPLYNGEAIRTSSKAEVRIQFADGDRFIDLEADSLIVISQTQGETNLDLMDGSFTVSQSEKEGQAGTPGTSKLTLNSKQGKVDLSKATATLSKSAGDKIDVQVLKGKATVEDANGQSKVIDSNKADSQTITILNPSIIKPTSVNIEDIQPILFQWKGAPPSAQIQLWIGKSRKDLKQVAVAEPGKTSLSSKINIGKHFWKLVAVDPISKKSLIESSANKLEIIGRYAPVAIFPEPDATVVRNSNPFKMGLKWTKPDFAKNVYLELSKDPTFKTKLYTKNFLSEERMEFTFPEGDYFWRLSSNYDGIDKPLSSKILKFTVSGAAKPKLPPIIIGWINPEEKTPQFYFDQPMASWAWTADKKEFIKSWRLRIADSEESFADDSKVKIISTKEYSSKTPVAKPGRYIAMVEALDEKQQVIAKSNFKAIEVSPQPPLPAPKFEPLEGDLKADNRGRLPLKWTNLDGAKEYNLSLLDPNGKELRSGKFNKNSTALVNLLPGKYKVTIYAIDQHGRPSAKEEPRSVIVPEGSSLGAPKLKKIQVK